MKRRAFHADRAAGDPVDLPLDRPMTAEERVGFALACDCFQLWGAQIEQGGLKTGGPSDPIPRNQMMAHAGRMMQATAEALSRSMAH